MKLRVERDSCIEEKKRRGKGVIFNKIEKEENRYFILKVKLEDVSEELTNDLKDYNYTEGRSYRLEKKPYFLQSISF